MDFVTDVMVFVTDVMVSMAKSAPPGVDVMVPRDVVMVFATSVMGFVTDMMVFAIVKLMC
eukprot:10246378-Lingulodinium_polyedra.AAC.1